MFNDAPAGTVPTNTTYWQILAEKGDTGAAGADGADSTVPGPAGADGLTVSVNSVTQVAGNITLDQDDIPDGTTNKAYTATEQSKLAGIETAADVTDAINVAAAGAIMDGDFSSNGVMTRTAAGTYTNRTITGTTNQITVTNGDGVSGNPTLSLPSAITTPGSLTITGHLSPLTDSLYTNGTSSLYWSNTYTDRLYLNSTAYLNGGTAGQAELTGKLKITSTAETQLDLNSNGALVQRWFTRTADSVTGFYDVTQSRTWFRHISGAGGAQSLSLLENGGNVGIFMAGTTVPTHHLTFGSGSTGIALYNTADQTTNYERVRAFWNSNIFNIYGEVTGSGSTRAIMLSAFGVSTQGILLANSSASGFVQSKGTSTTAGAIVHSIDGTHSSSSGTQYGLRIATTLNQSSTAGYTALLINPTETATGSGTKLLADFQVGGTSKVSIKNDGVIFPVQAVTASAPTYVKGGIYFDTTLNKLRIGGATGWETVTSS